MSSETENPTQATSPPEAASEGKELKEKVIDVLKSCFDPEIPVNIYELGLIYDVAVKPEGKIQIKMTLTSPMCPVAESLPPEVEMKVKKLPEVNAATVEVVWEPTWEPSMMSDAAKLQLNMM